MLSLLVALHLRSKNAKALAQVEESRSKAEALLSELQSLEQANRETKHLILQLQQTTSALPYSVQLLESLQQSTPEGISLRQFKYLPQLSKEGKRGFQIVCYADNSTLDAPGRIKKMAESLKKLTFVEEVSISSGVPTRRNQYELKYTLKVYCR